MKFKLYLDAVMHCQRASVPLSEIQRKGDLWLRYWVVEGSKKKAVKRQTKSNSRGGSCHA